MSSGFMISAYRHCDCVVIFGWAIIKYSEGL
jgi:hypothetical protein